MNEHEREQWRKRRAREQEARRRQKLELFRSDFPLFSQNCLQIFTKKEGLQPFKLNNIQTSVHEQLEEQRRQSGKVRAIILKGRQQGLSTYCSARSFWHTSQNKFKRTAVMAHNSAASDALFNMSKLYYDYMPDEMKPTVGTSNAKKWEFNELLSWYRVFTAENSNSGRGETMDILHASECGLWKPTVADDLMAGLFETVPEAEGTEIIMESTANGANNMFHKRWLEAMENKAKGNWDGLMPVFSPWFDHNDCSKEAPDDWIMEPNENEIAAEFGLTRNQMYWRYQKRLSDTGGNFQQEYPATWEEAFKSSGTPVFDQAVLAAVEPNPIVSLELYNDATKTFEANNYGHLKIYEPQEFHTKYVIGVDVAEGNGNDNSALVVMSEYDKVVATFKDNTLSTAEYAELVAYLSRRYNNALVICENTGIGKSVCDKLEAIGIQNLYVETEKMNQKGIYNKKIGFNTTGASKPRIIGELKASIKRREIDITCADLKDELLTYVETRPGKTEAAPGKKDDLVMSFAMTWDALRTRRHQLTNTFNFQAAVSKWGNVNLSPWDDNAGC